MDFAQITDVHLSLDNSTDSPAILFPGQIAAPAEMAHLISEIIAAIKAAPGQKRITACGAKWRIESIRGQRVALRKIPREVISIDSLGLPAMLKGALLKSDNLDKGGAIIIFGQPHAGKTTLYSSLIDGLLRSFGGYALSIEDPIEFPLEGFRGKGYCEQMDADEVGGYEMAIKKSLRCFPACGASILGFGEVRDNHTAAALSRAAVSSNLVITTYHSKDIPTGMQRLYSMATAGGESMANELLAQSLRVAVHLKFDLNGNWEISALVPEASTIAQISQCDFGSLARDVANTKQRLKLGSKP